MAGFGVGMRPYPAGDCAAKQWLKSMGAAVQMAALWVVQPLAADRQQSAITLATALLVRECKSARSLRGPSRERRSVSVVDESDPRDAEAERRSTRQA
jgi:hypothetical protein